MRKTAEGNISEGKDSEMSDWYQSEQTLVWCFHLAMDPGLKYLNPMRRCLISDENFPIDELGISWKKLGVNLIDFDRVHRQLE
jgi:hypothetical protein